MRKHSKIIKIAGKMANLYSNDRIDPHGKK